jgi:hypothetical protein
LAKKADGGVVKKLRSEMRSFWRSVQLIYDEPSWDLKASKTILRPNGFSWLWSPILAIIEGNCYWHLMEANKLITASNWPPPFITHAVLCKWLDFHLLMDV